MFPLKGHSHVNGSMLLMRKNPWKNVSLCFFYFLGECVESVFMVKLSIFVIVLRHLTIFGIRVVNLTLWMKLLSQTPEAANSFNIIICSLFLRGGQLNACHKP